MDYITLWLGAVIYGILLLVMGKWSWDTLFGCSLKRETGWPCRKDRLGGCECGRGR